MSMYAKAIVSVVMSILMVLNAFFGIDLGISEATVNTVVAALLAIVTPIIVYFVPNK